MAIAVDTTTSSISTGFSGTVTKTWSHTCTGSGLLLVLEASLWQDVAGTGTITSASYNGVAMTFVTADRGAGMRSELWYLTAPATGAHTVSVTVTGNTDAIKLATTSFTGVDQSSPLSVSNTANSFSANATVSLTTTVANTVVVGALSKFGTAAPTTGSPYTNLAVNSTTSTTFSADYALVSSAGSTTLTYTTSTASDWSISIASFKPLPVITGTLAVTDGADTLVASGAVRVTGSLAQTDAADTSAASGSVSVSGTLALIDDPDTISASGAVLVTGSLNTGDDPDMATAAGQVLVTSTGSATDDPDILVASGRVTGWRPTSGNPGSWDDQAAANADWTPLPSSPETWTPQFPADGVWTPQSATSKVWSS